ncbi:MAG: DUF1501 domain-containing protein [Lysobacteraceae bacterium]|nr:MAG: DUF1501 domain-containing protein [Xanthomonadaceae bacterium]
MNDHPEIPTPVDVSRRRFLAGAAATTLLTLWPGQSWAASGQNRMLVVLLRGALDGLHWLPPYADPAYARARGALAVADPLRLDGSFGVHPKLDFARQLFADRELLPLLAVAPPYRQRSHFDAQDCLENGTAEPGGARDGWIGRCVGAMRGAEGVAIAQVMPLAMRGSAQAEIWSPPLPRDLSEELLRQLQPLYAADTRLAPAFDDAMNADRAAMDARRGAFRLPDAMAAAAKLMRGPDAPRVGFVEDSGWDTHRAQANALDRKLAELDAGLRAAKTGFGDEWARTVIVVVTEFGRTVAVNGSAGTDHGVGGHALLAGGAVRGGRIVGDWPGLTPRDLHEGRDLRPTTDMRGLFKGVLSAHLGISENLLETSIFPDSRGVRPLGDLVRS